MPKIKDLRHEARIDTMNSPFIGRYEWVQGGAVYWLDAKVGTGDIHFTVPGNDNDEFRMLHISTEVGNGANGAVRYRMNQYGEWFYPMDVKKIYDPTITNISELRPEYRERFRTWLESKTGDYNKFQWCAYAAMAFVGAVS
jgi:hypothetical protein